MLRSRRVEGVADAGERCGLTHEFVAEKFVEASRAEFERIIWRPVETKVVAKVLLRRALGVISGQTARQDKEISDLRRSISRRGTRTEQPLCVELVQQRQFRRRVLELAVSSGERSCRNAGGPSV